VVAISAGWSEWLALKADGTVVSSGWNSVPTGLTNVVAISVAQGSDHHINLALKSDGTVVGWGYNFYGGPFVPENLGKVAAIASGGGHTLALVGGGPPFLTVKPRSRKVLGTGTNYFYAQATGAWPLNYQWQLNGANLPGANSPALAVTNAQPDQAGLYTVVVRNAFGTATASAELQVLPLGITAQPQALSTFARGPATMNIGVLGFDLNYQWRKDGIPIPGATNSSLHFENALLDQSGIYTVAVSNRWTTVFSEPAVLSVLPVLLVEPPTNQVAFWHGSAKMSVTALGAGPLRYQWRFNGADLPNATNSSLILSDLEKSQTGHYDVVVGNSYGSVPSDEAWLTVTPVARWGDLGQSTVPASLTDVKAIAVGLFHELALTADGTVVAWSENFSGQTDVPPGLTNIVAIASGSYSSQSQALTEGGVLLVWGTTIYTPAQPPAGLSNVVAMSSGQQHAVAVTSYGNVTAWGYGSFGENETPAGLSNVMVCVI
jgi:hypothetical protein